MITRIVETRVQEVIKKFPVTGIIGPRQCGKTTLVKSIMKYMPGPALYLDLESITDLRKLSDPELFLNENIDKCIIIDEIQRKPELFPLLRSLVDKKRSNGKFIILGSSNPLMLRHSSESLAGRIAYIEMTPFTVEEIINKYTVNLHWLRGGYPLSFLAKTNNDSMIWLDNFIKTYLERDFAQMGANLSPFILRNFLIMLANNHGSLLNISMLSKSISISNLTINKYLDFLEASFLIHRLFPFHTNLRKRIVKTPKIYFRDSGILNRLLEISNMNNLLSSLYRGRAWEGYVIEQIQSVKNPNTNLFFFRTQDGSEIDLVFTKSNEVTALLEIKSSSAFTLSKGNYYALSVLGAKYNFVIVPGSFDYPLNNDIRVCGLTEFLSKYINLL
jgi:hypothetical protein